MKHRGLLSHLLVTIIGVLLLLPTSPAFADNGNRLKVSPDGPYTTITDALEDASDGDIIEVHGGTYPAPLVITKSVSIMGFESPIIDGEGEGTLVFVQVPDVTLSGFTIRNSGAVQHHEDAGIVIEAPRATITNNKLENVLYGIFFAFAEDGIARDNFIQGIGDDPAMRGDGIRVWYSHNVSLIDNHVVHTRDTLIWYSDNIHIEGNVVEDSRYGLHFMYNHSSQIKDNVFENNSVGAFLMYSIGADIEDNIFAYNRGPSGYGLALKDMDEVDADNNFFVGNRAGLYLDNSPALYEGHNMFSGNVFAYNDIGTTALPAVERNIFTGNSYLENIQQVSMRGREIVSRNIWTHDGIGNYWSDYAGYDRDGDGIGESAYKSDKLFESLTDEYPVIQFFNYSPASQAIEFTSAAFPIVRPQAKLVDNAPLMTYEFPAYLEADSGEPDFTLLALSMLLVFGVGGVIALMVVGTPITRRISVIDKGVHMIKVNGLQKKYGKHIVLDNFTFEIKQGESVALWGTNGAGKTTTLKCMLGVTSFEGEIRINNLDVSQQGKKVRSLVGYVPQEAVFYDMTVLQTIKFYARLKRAGGETDSLLERVGLLQHTSKPVRALSGGMKQRLALAISLLGDPPILILDEPTANLDAGARHDYLQLIQTLNDEGKTIVFSTHRFDEVVVLASRVLVLRDNELSVDCAPNDLPKHLKLNQWLKVWISQTRWEEAFKLLDQQGFTYLPNKRAIYVDVTAESKMQALRILENAEITVDDFDLVNASQVRTPDDD
jgi:nitrous oxidase accessory protein